MGKNKQQRKRSRSSAKAATTDAAWKPVKVKLPGESSGNDNDDATNTDHDEIQLSKNHYDDPKLFKKAERELEMNPGEDCAMFYGLEVLDASQYQVVGTGSSKRLIITGGADGRGDVEEKESAPSSKPRARESDDQEELPSKKKRKKDKKKSKDDGDEHEKLVDTKKNKQNEDMDEPMPNADDGDGDDAEPSDSSKKSKKKKKSKKNDKEQQKEEAGSASHEDEKQQPLTSDQLAKIQTSWSESSGGAHIHNRLLESLHRLGFEGPTPIQSATLAAAIMGRRNLVGAAPTGSGKTLAFLIPILNHLLEQQSEREDDGEDDAQQNSFVQALIMTPTRELATQIHAECDKLLPNQCVTLVGGIALVKQARMLRTKKPPIVIATPGRLWAMLSSGEHEHLRDLSKIRFLVLDEADRMTQEHSFPQLIKILDTVHDANPREEDVDDGSDDSDSEDEDGDRLLGLPGVRGEAQLTMLTDDILQGIAAQKDPTEPESKDIPDEEYPEEDSDDEEDIPDNDLDDAFIVREKVPRQTFIYSATLTLPFTSTKSITSSKAAKKSRKLGLEGGIAEILEKTRAMGETKVVDLSSSSPVKTAGGKQAGKSGVRLPPGLSLEQIKCTQMHKDSHLYAYLMTTEQGASGPCLVFCNSIAGVRRVGATLTTLGFNVRILHAHMQQRARFKAVESLKASKTRTVVVSTDVAARGLDIPSVSTVVHYDVARAVDTFVHRSGRTARGIGTGAVGSSLSLISPAEDKAHSKIVQSLGVAFHKVLLDGRLLTSSQERTNLASKIISADEMQQKTNSSNRWFLEKAKEAELELDDGLMEDESNRSEKEQQQLLEAKKARVRLAQLLAEPMKRQKFGKFLSTHSEAAQNGLSKTLLKRAA